MATTTATITLVGSDIADNSFSVSNTTTLYNFTITATDAESQTVDGLFSIQVTDGALGGAQFI